MCYSSSSKLQPDELHNCIPQFSITASTAAKSKMGNKSSSIDDLVQACGDGRIDDVRAHLKVGIIDVNGLGNYIDVDQLMTPLIAACWKGHTEILALLVEHGADVNAKNNDGWTALMLASQNGHVDVVNCLLSHGADVNAKNERGATALMAASQNGHVEVVTCLLNHGADVNAQLFIDGRGTLEFAVSQMSEPWDACALLFEAGKVMPDGSWVIVIVCACAIRSH